MVYPKGKQLEVDGLLVPPRKIRRLGDFYPLLIDHSYSSRALHRTHFPEEQIEKELNKHTLRIDYEL